MIGGREGGRRSFSTRLSSLVQGQYKFNLKYFKMDKGDNFMDGPTSCPHSLQKQKTMQRMHNKICQHKSNMRFIVFIGIVNCSCYLYIKRLMTT